MSSPIRLYFPENGIESHMPCTEKSCLPFDLEPGRFELTHDIHSADIIPTISHHPVPEIAQMLVGANNPVVLCYPVFHVAEDSGQMYQGAQDAWAACTKNFYIAQTDYAASSNHSCAYTYDFMWNRQKAYFVDYYKYVKDSALLKKSDVSRIWTAGTTKKAYALPELVLYDTNNPNAYKSFLSPNRITLDYLQTKRGIYRRLLSDHLWFHQAHFSDWMSDTFLEAEEPSLQVNNKLFGGWWPVANHYYTTSCVSVYVETLVTHTKIRTLTEKTFDPLIKGHFVLPFGYCGLVSDIKAYGFQLPDWIDYSYDSEPDELNRFYKFIQEFRRLSEYSTLELMQLRNADLHILEHNRNIFFQRPYDSMYSICKDILRRSVLPTRK